MSDAVASGVPLLDSTRLEPALKERLREAFDRVLASGKFILGPDVPAFEQEMAAYLGVRETVGVSSGTDALLVALMALGVGPGDDVVCPTYTFVATAGSIARVGARTVFADCDPVSFNAEPEYVERALTARTKAVIAVDLFGQCPAMNPLLELCRRKGLPLIEDVAQALGAQDRGRQAGSMGTLGCFSFFPTKNLGTAGDAGLVSAQDADLAARVRRLRVQGAVRKYYHEAVGGNFRIDTLHAALLRAKLPYLEGWIAQRRRNAAFYDRGFAEAGVPAMGVVLPTEAPGQRHTYNQYVIRVTGTGRRDGLRRFLTDRQIGTENYYPTPMHLQPCFASLRYKAGDLPHAEAAAAESLALPIFPGLREDEMRAVVAGVAAYIRENPAR